MGEECNGNSLMEVFQIIYLGGDEVEPKDQSGTIKLITRYGVQYLYNVNHVDSWEPSIKHGDQIKITVPAPTIRCAEICIEFDLFCGAYKGTIMVDWEECHTYMNTAWDKKIESQDGTGEISVVYGLFLNATVAHVEVEFLDTSFEDIYGIVAASNSALQDLPMCASVLFVTPPDYNYDVYVVLDPVIPLSKSRVAVPLDTTLYVHLFLNCDGEVYRDKLCFDAGNAGQVSQVDRSNKIQVRVDWEANEDSILSTYNEK